MANKKNDQTASFMVRFNQKIYEDGEGESQVQWKGRISHVQGGEQVSFTDFSEAIDFMHSKLSGMTKEATSDKTQAEQEGILAKSFDMWRKLSTTGAKMAMETIKDPRKSVANIQEQLQEQISQVGGDLTQRLEIDEWRNASKSDYKQIMQTLATLTEELQTLNKKVDKLSKKK